MVAQGVATGADPGGLNCLARLNRVNPRETSWRPAVTAFAVGATAPAGPASCSARPARDRLAYPWGYAAGAATMIMGRWCRI